MRRSHKKMVASESLDPGLHFRRIHFENLKIFSHLISKKLSLHSFWDTLYIEETSPSQAHDSSALRPCLGFVKEKHVVAAGQLGQVGLGQLERLHSAVMPKFHLDSGTYTVKLNNFPPTGKSNYLTNHGDFSFFPSRRKR